ncbi:two pore domain potassium channel family protein [Silicimonas algicola]|uniref:Ion channel n=1 Tax=Silicimonas algicola TaxID=1826607 RepID=A0A316G8T4_9RHOB|nr:ion channel [Silicimonas algicola]AZQ65683.1 two pore domain potassium channel family protein [Silicimonas algicola]PWK56625.1 ion channel [Silicimonas algicola]
MLTQLVLGSLIIFLTVVLAAVSWWGLEQVLLRLHPWAVRPPHGPKLIVVLTLALIWTLGMMTLSVWVWALALHALHVFTSFEESIYFSLVAFTTLGFGDILLPVEWRLLGGMAAANGLLMFGLLTAIMVETLRDTRQKQRNPRP